MADEKPGYMDGGWKRKYYIQKWREQVCGVCTAGTGTKPASFHFEDNRFCPGTQSGYKTFHCCVCGGTGLEWYLVEADRWAIYFVLRLDEDPHARKAACAYADSVEPDNPQLAADIRRKVGEADSDDADVGTIRPRDIGVSGKGAKEG